MAAIDDLKKLVYKGYLTEEVEIDGTKFTLSTLSALEEFDVFDEAGLSDFPNNEKETIRYLIALLKRAVKKVNGEPITSKELDEVFKKADKVLLVKLYGAYGKLLEKRKAAGDEIKN